MRFGVVLLCRRAQPRKWKEHWCPVLSPSTPRSGWGSTSARRACAPCSWTAPAPCSAAGRRRWNATCATATGTSRTPPSGGVPPAPPPAPRAPRDAVPAGHRLAHQADHVGARLAGHPVPTDWSHALKTGYDLLGDAWPASVLDRLGVDPEVLPPVVAPGERVAVVSDAAAEESAIPAGTPIAAGMTDG